jgi:hypothetical protein
LRPSPTRDGAIAAYASQILERDASAAFSWSGSIADPERRRHALHELAVSWFKRDPVKAYEWLQGSADFSPDEKQRMLLRE